MRKYRVFVWLFFCLALVGNLFMLPQFGSSLKTITVSADEVADLEKQIGDLSRLKKLSEDATTPLEKQVSDLEKRIASAQAGINSAKAKAAQVAKSIKEREASLGVTYERFNERVVAQYVNGNKDWSLVLLATKESIGDFIRDYEYRQRVREQDQQELGRLSQEITQYEKDKADLDATQKKLAVLQESLDKSADFFKGEIAKAKKYQADLAGKIAVLSARQQEILAERTGTASTTVGDVPLADDPNSRPTYNPGFSPAFAAFSFGAPHFKGMSQYGAFGRAKAGQNAEAILQAYYGGLELKKDFDTGRSICVGSSRSSCTNVDLETYAKRIYEMPGSWGDEGGMEALKAQAVAARSYALNSMDRNGYICTTEACQVYKPQNKGGKWEEAVNATRGWVLQSGGKPYFAQYASTSGGYQQSYSSNGYSTPGFWDSTSDWSRWAEGAYEAKAGSPWFYKGWYKSRSGDSCGRSHPWLTQDEFADILNAWQVRYHGGDASRITPQGPCWSGNPYSADELRAKANEVGGAFTSVTGVRVEHGSNGYTKNVIVDTNKGSVSIPGAEFKTAFNLRAPGRLAIKGNLFSIEKK